MFLLFYCVFKQQQIVNKFDSLFDLEKRKSMDSLIGY